MPAISEAVMRVRPIADNDWDALMSLENAAYAAKALSEDRNALLSKQRVSPSTCFVVAIGRRLAGYLLSLPYPAFRCPALAHIETTEFQSRNLHLHDLVIDTRFRGKGLAKQLLHTLTRSAQANHFQSISLVAVGGSEPFWLAQGYNRCADIELPVGYGEQAVYMQMRI
jgi:ribosomal protein S18 acetylase RimI-like enzyme